MNSKEKLQKALNHEQAEIPIDFGASAVTGIHCSVVENLRNYYGLEKRPVIIHEPYQMLGLIEPDLGDAMGVDVIGVQPRNTMFGFPSADLKEWTTPWGQNVLVGGNFNTTRDGEDIYIYPEGDLSVPASGHMPSGGYFFDTIIRQQPISEENLNPEENIEEFGSISDEDLVYFKESCENAAKTDKGIIANFGGSALGDIALVPAPGLKYPKGIRDVTEWYVSTAIRQDYIHEVFRLQTEIVLSNLKKIFQVVGNIPDAVFICGTDFGTQSSQFCSAETFESLYAPYYRKINNWIHSHTSWKTFKHSCGAVEPLISNIIGAGFDVLNPVQCSAVGMNPKKLKEKYGDDLVFWGGGVDTQHTLPFDYPEVVKQEVLHRLETFGGGGGYVFNAIHNIQAGTPIDNVTIMLDAVNSYNKEIS